MDNVTHALAGLLLAEATVAAVARRTGDAPSAGLRRAAIAIGVVGAELPDADILYAGPVLDLLGMGQLGYLLHHRGHTHTLVFGLAAAIVLWAIARLARRGQPSVERRALLALALAATLSHVLLDWTNNYGVHPFWPASNAWHYGDAVFIVEPWLWIAALAPLLLLARGWVGRVLLGVALGGIVVAAWGTGQVERGVAVALTVGAAGWLGVVAAAPAARRVVLGLLAWLAVEGAFFTASARAERAVAAAVGPTLRDAVLTPAVGDPRCVRAIVVELDAGTYRVTRATVAPFPAVRAAADCRDAGDALAPGALASTRAATPQLRWGGEWSAPAAELATLAGERCEIAAALRFIRVPRWSRSPSGDAYVWDVRYGRGGFAGIVAPAVRPARCPSPVPPWEMPRGDVIGEGEAGIADGKIRN